MYVDGNSVSETCIHETPKYVYFINFIVWGVKNCNKNIGRQCDKKMLVILTKR